MSWYYNLFNSLEQKQQVNKNENSSEALISKTKMKIKTNPFSFARILWIVNRFFSFENQFFLCFCEQNLCDNSNQILSIVTNDSCKLNLSQNRRKKKNNEKFISKVNAMKLFE